MSATHVPVLIVGAGSVGLSAALFLAQHRVPALVVERHAALSMHPRAAGIGIRAMELFRAAGLEQAIHTTATAQTTAGRIISVDTLAGADLQAAAQSAPSPEARPQTPNRFSPTSAASCPQDRLDPILLDAAIARGATVRFATELVAIVQDETGVTATLAPRNGDAPYTVRADYLIAADGSASSIRHTLGIATDGPGPLGHTLINVLFETDLSNLVGGYPFLAFVIGTPQAPGLLTRVRGNDRWLFNFSYAHEKGERPEDYTPERCRALVRAAIGVPDCAVDILSILPWHVEALVANRFRHGRVFLVGDAAHVMPPTGGFGMSTGIADAHNLAWKLALVLAGKAEDMLLDTYDTERRPIARFTMDQALLRLAHPELHWDRTRIAEREQLGIADDLVMHLGLRYPLPGNGAPAAMPPSLQHLDRDLDGSPGSRVPHLWVERHGEQVSTLDLIGTDFTLLAGPDGADWCAAASVAAARVGIAVPAFQIGTGTDLIPQGGDWQSAVGIEADGALLVRPDGYIAWRAAHRKGDLTQALTSALECQLGHRHAQ